MDHFPENGWMIKDDALVFEPSDKGEWTSGLDIITKERYGDFELELEWMVSKGGEQWHFLSHSGAARKSHLLVCFGDASAGQ